jgi:oligopeptide/dipeptide ABC transporter ATP-binding protein
MCSIRACGIDRRMNRPLLDVNDLGVSLHTGKGTLAAVDGVSFAIGAGETLALVGESGCGKTMTALSVMRLVPDPPGRIERGQIRFGNEDLLAKTPEEMRRLRGDRLSMVFQEPMTSLDPVFTVGRQLTETVLSHREVGRDEAARLSVAMLQRVKIPDPARRMRAYPHEMSGGMRQRVMIAMALLCRPDLLIADEPTTALDVTTQAQILELIRELRAEFGMAVLLITHALGVVAEMADRVAVMYAGRIVESASVEEIFRAPRHPYTVGLLNSIPDLARPQDRLATIPGAVPNLLHLPPGCRFWPRCPLADAGCCAAQPSLAAVGDNHLAACWKAGA